MRFALGRGRGASPPSARCDLLEMRSTSSNGVSRNISPGPAAVKRGESDFGLNKIAPPLGSVRPRRALDVRDDSLTGAGAEAGAPAWPLAGPLRGHVVLAAVDVMLRTGRHGPSMTLNSAPGPAAATRRDDRSLSAWIRRAVEHELRRTA